MSDRAVLAHWIAQQKIAERALEEARADGKKWFQRAKLAKEQGRLDLVEPARQQALEARERFEKAARLLAEAKQERETAAKEAREVKNRQPFEDAQRRAEHAKGEFAKLGIDPEFAALETETEAAIRAAEEELAGNDDDALARLRSSVASTEDDA